MEFAKELIERLLRNWDFDVEHIPIDSVQHVPMHEWRTATNAKPLLYIENLKCCVGLYAYGNNFAFAAHINTVIFDQDEYDLDENENPLYCNRCQDLLTQILKYEGNITEPFKIGIALGCAPLADTEKSMELIYRGVEEVIKELNYFDIPLIQQENIYESHFLIDSVNNCLITPKQDKITLGK